MRRQRLKGKPERASGVAGPRWLMLQLRQWRRVDWALNLAGGLPGKDRPVLEPQGRRLNLPNGGRPICSPVLYTTTLWTPPSVCSRAYSRAVSSIVLHKQSGMAHAAPNLFMHMWARLQPPILLPALSVLWNQRESGNLLQHFRYTTDVPSGEENKTTIECLSALSVDIKKIRRLKAWVLLKQDTCVQENIKILQEIGADRSAIAYILELCPEAILCRPADISRQIDLWLSVCRNEKQLVELIKRFPESFFAVQHYENQKANVKFFQDLGLKNTIISRLLAGASHVFYNPVEKNKHMVETLQNNFLSLGGSQENMKNWLLKLLSQNPFIVLNTSAVVQENLGFLQKNNFTDSEVLSLLSKLKGFVFQLNPRIMQNSMLFSKKVFKCSDQELKELIIKCPALLYYSVPVLEERLEGLLKVGVSVGQIKETPAVLELTTEIVQYRVKKLTAFGYNIGSGTLECLNGTKRDFEANYGKIQAKKERPLFNPVAPLNTDD